MLVSTISGYSLDAVLTRILPAPPAANTNVATGITVAIVTADWGPVNVPTQTANLPDYVKKFGSYRKATVGNDETSGYALARGYFDGGQKKRIAGGGNDLRVIRVVGSSKANAAKVVTDASSGTVGTLTALYPGQAGNGIKTTLTPTTGVLFNLTVTPFDGSPDEVYLGIDKTTAVSAINGVSKYVTWAAGASTNAPAAIASAFLTGGDSGLAALDADYVGANGATGIDLAKTVTDASFVLAGKSSASVKAALKTAAVLMWAQTIVGPDDTSVTAAAMVTEAQALNSWNVVYIGDYLNWENPISGATQAVLPVGSVAGALCNGPYWVNLSQTSLLGYLGPTTSRSETEANTMAAGGVIPITAGNKCRKGSNTSTDAAINQIEDFRIPVFFAKALDQSVAPMIAEPQDHDDTDGSSTFFSDLKEAAESVLRKQPKEALQRAYVDATYDPTLAETNKARLAAVIRTTPKGNQIIIDLTAARTALRVVPAGVNLIQGA